MQQTDRTECDRVMYVIVPLPFIKTAYQKVPYVNCTIWLHTFILQATMAHTILLKFSI